MGTKSGRIEGADAKFQAWPQYFDRLLGAASSKLAKRAAIGVLMRTSNQAALLRG
jgi:hypothetical protein